MFRGSQQYDVGINRLYRAIHEVKLLFFVQVEAFRSIAGALPCIHKYAHIITEMILLVHCSRCNSLGVKHIFPSTSISSAYLVNRSV
nr:unnamed protein product [Haemonchus contortus]